MLDSITLQDIMTLGGSAGAVILILAWKFSDEIKVLLTSRGAERKQIINDVAELRKIVVAHVEAESAFWTKQDDRVTKVEEKNHDLEIQLTGLAATVNAQHLAVVNKLSELTSAVMESLRHK